eukprot:360432-Chlamydomonas_euryale.AAC.6
MPTTPFLHTANVGLAPPVNPYIRYIRYTRYIPYMKSPDRRRSCVYTDVRLSHVCECESTPAAPPSCAAAQRLHIISS